MLLSRSSSVHRVSFALILALVLLASGFAAPAAAQSTDQESEQEGESGDADQSGEVSDASLFVRLVSVEPFASISITKMSGWLVVH